MAEWRPKPVLVPERNIPGRDNNFIINMFNIIILVIAISVMFFTVLVYWAGHNFDSDFGKFMKQISIFNFVIGLSASIYSVVRMVFKL